MGLIIGLHLREGLQAISNIRIKNSYKKNSQLNKRILLTFSDEGIITEAEDKKTWKWVSIKNINTTKDYLYLTFLDSNILLIPNKSFSSTNDLVNFQGYIENKCKTERGNSEHQQDLVINSKPPYALGIISFLPLVGAIFGLIFLLIGIVKYKSKKIILISVIGILISVLLTFAVYKSFINFTEQMNKDLEPALELFSQFGLKSIVKEIEIYKIKNGQYPDSLEQLELDNSMIDINDLFLPAADKTKGGKYFYQKVDDRYYLFSVGLDKIPNTTDDINPKLSETEIKKYGLIIR